MEVSNNIFSGGQNSDLSKTITKPNQYLKALNFRPITELGESTGSLTNIKGNSCSVQFPNVRGVYKIKISKKYTGTVFNNGIVTFTINGQIINFNVVQNTTMSELYGTLISLPNCYNNPLSFNPNFSIAYNEDHLIIYQTASYNNCDIVQSIEPLISITVNNINNSSLVFVDKDDITYTNQFYYIPPIINDALVVIGSTFINETNYLFTCSNTNANKTGQIWSLDYNDLTKNSILKLLYNNFLNFTIYTPIAPSAAIGRYEINTIQRIYWSDFKNPVRGLNTQDPQLMSIDINLINLRPSISMNIPVLKTIIDSGSIIPLNTFSTYQCSYRLLKNNGALTNYSPISNLIYPVVQKISDFDLSQPNFASLSDQGDTTVNKTIEWEVDGIDTSFDTIEFIAIIRKNSDSQSSYKCYKFDTRLINGNNKVTTIFKNDIANYVSISLDEFLIENTTFTHCKTLEQKDNRLFFANIKNEVSEYLEKYDTRAYRFGNNGTGNGNQIKVKKFDSDTTTTTYTIASINDYIIPENTDLIPALNLGLSAYDDLNQDKTFKYQKNSTIVGGEGPNIKFSFGNVLLRSDDLHYSPFLSNAINNGTSRDNNSSSMNYKNGFRRAGGQLGSTNINPFSNESIFQTYRQNNIRMSMGLEYLNGLFKSYQHNEIYRFGIMFYSKTGDTTFVKWIADIKMPDYSDLINPALIAHCESGNTCPDFRSMFLDSATGAYCNIPYIEFEVNIDSTLSKLTDGYQIVRVKREEADKTIISQGLITQVATGLGSVSNTDIFLPISHYISFGGYGNADPPTYGISSLTGPNPALADGSFLAYHSLGNLIEKKFPYQQDDNFILTEKYGMSGNPAPINPSGTVISGSYEEYYYISKYNTWSQFLLDGQTALDYRLKIFDGKYVDQDDKCTIGGLTYNNRDYFPDSTNPTIFDNRAYAQGSPTCILSVNFTNDRTGSAIIDWEKYSCTGNNAASGYNGTGSFKLMGMHYRPVNLKSQYKGRTYFNRSEVEYISTGAYSQTDKSGVYKTKVFGGDIYHGILDIQKCIKNWAGLRTSPYSKKHSQTWYFPTQSAYNVDLRGGIHVNADLNSDSGSGYGDTVDTYTTGDFSKLENTLQRYFPKPIFFNQTGDYNNRIYYSLVKINGENSDSWTSIPVNNYYDVEGNYGGINALVILRNNMYFLQDRALGILLINPLAMINPGGTSIDTAIKLGQGKTIEKHNYYSIDTGTKHQWSVYRSNSDITFVDVRHKKVYLFDGQQLTSISDIEGNKNIIVKLLHSNILVQDNPIIGNGILTTYDFYNNEFLYTFLTTYKTTLDQDDIRSRYTLAYSDLTKNFTSFYSFTPYIYINNNNKLYSLKDYLTPITPTSISIYLHNVGNYSTFYGILYPSKLKVNINDKPLSTKIIDNLSWLTESIKDNLEYIDDFIDEQGPSDNINYLNDTFKKIRCYNEYQNTDYINLTVTNPISNIRKSEQGWNIQTLRNKVNLDTTNINIKSIFDPSILTKTTFGDRLRDKYLIVDLYYDNALNNRFIVHNLKSTYRLSDR